MNVSKILPETIIKFIKIYFVAILLFTIFRFILLIDEIDRINESIDKKDVAASFVMGLRFDIVIASYILIVPFAVMATMDILNKKSALVNKAVFYFIYFMFSVAFMVCAVDIPYFHQFFSRFSISAFEWADSPIFVLKMIVQEPSYWLYSIPFFISAYLFYRITINVFVQKKQNNNLKPSIKIILSLLFLCLMFIGIRGRIEKKSPIRVGTAFFSTNPFINQLGLNPNFTLIRSYLDSRNEENKKAELIDDKIAILNVQKYLHINKPDKNFPLLRKIAVDSGTVSKYNVVLILMESMSAAKMARHGNANNLTPFLDSISHSGYYFENTYSAGIHTFNGVFSTLFSYPAIFRQHPMKGSSLVKYHGIFSALKRKGYSTSYFTTHDGQFDNIEGFLKSNDCENFISKSDYPSEEVKTTLGVPDDFMFRFSIPYLNKLSQQDKPFFATFMTASDHGPFYLPEYFKPKSSEIKNQMVEYADYSLRKFIRLSSEQEWFNNTIFVFVADHGAPLDNVYDMSLKYNHIPLLFYAPGIFKEGKMSSNMAGQIDVFPTIMGLLNLNYTNNTLGIDLFKQKRPYIFFNADDKYGVIDNEWFLIVNTNGTKGLYKYRKLDKHNYADETPGIVQKMDTYAKSNIQAYQYVIKSNKQ